MPDQPRSRTLRGFHVASRPGQLHEFRRQALVDDGRTVQDGLAPCPVVRKGPPVQQLAQALPGLALLLEWMLLWAPVTLDP
jgi:hypothetical protein